MNNAIDQDLEQLTEGIYTAKPHDELESVLLFPRRRSIRPSTISSMA